MSLCSVENGHGYKVNRLKSAAVGIRKDPNLCHAWERMQIPNSSWQWLSKRLQMPTDWMVAWQWTNSRTISHPEVHYLIAKDTLDVPGRRVSCPQVEDIHHYISIHFYPVAHGFHPLKQKIKLQLDFPFNPFFGDIGPGLKVVALGLPKESMYQMLERKQHDVGVMLDGQASRLGAQKVGNKGTFSKPEEEAVPLQDAADVAPKGSETKGPKQQTSLEAAVCRSWLQWSKTYSKYITLNWNLAILAVRLGQKGLIS